MLRPHALRVVQRSSRSRVLHRFQWLCFAYVGPQGFGSCCEQLTLYLCSARSCRALVSCLDTADMARDDRGGLTVLTDAMRLVEGEDDGEEPAAAGATRVVPVEIRCWLTTSQLADLKSRLGTACARAVDLAVRQGFAGSVAGDDALGLLEQLSGFPQATPGPRSWRGLKISLHNFPPTKVPTRSRESIADILGVSAVAATAGMNQHMHEYLYQLTSAHLRCKASLPAWGGAGATSYPFWAQTLTLFLQRCHVLHKSFST